MLQVGKTYRLYGQIAPMRRMSPVGSGQFVVNLIYADLFDPKTDSDLSSMETTLAECLTQGRFEFRVIVVN